jgi:hypothetical protein
MTFMLSATQVLFVTLYLATAIGLTFLAMLGDEEDE